MQQRLAVHGGGSAAFGANPGLHALPASLEGFHTPLGAGVGELLLSLWPELRVLDHTDYSDRPSWLCSRVTAGHGAGGVQPRVTCCPAPMERAVSSRSEEAASALPAEAAQQPRDSWLPPQPWCCPFLTIHDSSRLVSLTVTNPGGPAQGGP